MRQTTVTSYRIPFGNRTTWTNGESRFVGDPFSISLGRVLFGLLCLLSLASPVCADRGRPHLDTALGFNVLLSDQDTLLRGVSLSWDGGDPYGSLPKKMPSQGALDALATDYGLNTVHLYLEGDSSGNTNAPGLNVADCDTLVERTAAAGLYLIITIGCNGENGTIHSLPWSLDFWNFYGPRYKNRTHVLYEAHNEPVRYSLASWTDSDWAKQVTLYQTIRAVAPDTFILLGSFMGFAGDPRYGANYLKTRSVSWANAGFAHHGYESLAGIEKAIALMKTSPAYPALLCTEFWPGDTAGQGYNSMYETHFNGWMQFQWLGTSSADLLDFKSKITAAGTVWTPDRSTCNWPAKGTLSLPREGAPVGLFSRGKGAFLSASPANGGDLKADQTAYSGAQHDAFVIEHVGSRRVRLKTVDGQYVRTVGATDSLSAGLNPASTRDQFEWLSLADGDFALRAYGGGGHLVSVNTATGYLLPNADNAHLAVTAFRTAETPGAPLTALVGTPYRAAPAVVPGVLEAEDFDRGGEGVAYHDNTAANTGGGYRKTDGVDLEGASEGGYNVAFLETGEWIEYTVNVTGGPGDYRLITRVATPNPGGTFHIEFKGIDGTGRLAVPKTGGWQTWSDLTRTVRLQPGLQIMRFVRDPGADFNLGKFTFVRVDGGGNDVRLEGGGANFGVQDSQFGFDVTGPSGQTVFIDACTNLTSPVWVPLATHTLTGVPYHFSDPGWPLNGTRFYRVRWP